MGVLSLRSNKADWLSEPDAVGCDWGSWTRKTSVGEALQGAPVGCGERGRGRKAGSWAHQCFRVKQRAAPQRREGTNQEQVKSSVSRPGASGVWAWGRVFSLLKFS